MGHVFRDKSPYTFPGGVAKIVNKNAARVAEVGTIPFGQAVALDVHIYPLKGTAFLRRLCNGSCIFSASLDCVISIFRPPKCAKVTVVCLFKKP